jgi:membrane dipeptidase
MGEGVSPDREAAALHAATVVIDGLDVSVLDRAHLEHMRQGGVTAANYTITLADGFDFRRTVEEIRRVDGIVAEHADLVRPVRSVDDIRAAKAENRTGIIYGFQNATPFERDVRLVAPFHDLGVRIVQLTYMTANLLGDGCLEPRNAGLTAFGRAIIGELDRVGILIDLSHVGDRSTLEAIDAAAGPVAITHANCRALCATPRNKTDEAIRALAGRGGVIGFTPLPAFVTDDPRDATLEGYLDHIDHAVQLVGVDHVGLGMDWVEGQSVATLAPEASTRWGGVSLPAPLGVAMMYPERLRPIAMDLVRTPYPAGISNVAELPNVTSGLLRRGYGVEDVRKILGLNWLRLLGGAWAD